MINKKNSFTLMELLVVVAIIGILAAIMIPVYQNALMKAQYTDVISDVSNFGTAMNLLFLDIETGNYPIQYLNGIIVLPSSRSNSSVIQSNRQSTTIAIYWSYRNSFNPLTTPIPYLNEIPEGPWSKTVLKNDEEIYRYNYSIVNGYVTMSDRWDKKPKTRVPSGKTRGWYIGSRGPTNLSSVERYQYAWYAPSNGLYSDGCVWNDYEGLKSW
jgi:prepilin-type N-terminal cleavage/methylation domain-containing protein